MKKPPAPVALGRIGAYLVALWIVAILCNLIIGSTEIALPVFLAVALLSAAALRTTTLVDKNWADTLYYIVGSFSVLMIFAYEAPERTRLNRLLELSAVRVEAGEVELEAAAVRREADLIDLVRSSPEVVLSAVRQYASDADAQEELLRNAACAEAMGINLPDLPALDATGADDPIGDVLKRQQAEQACEALTKQQDRPEWEQAKAVASLEAVRRLAGFLRGLSQAPLTVGGLAMSFADLEERILQERASEERAVDLARLAARHEELAGRFDALAADVDAGRLEEEIAAASDVGELVRLYWPFMLVSLFGLKLARNSKSS